MKHIEIDATEYLDKEDVIELMEWFDAEATDKLPDCLGPVEWLKLPAQDIWKLEAFIEKFRRIPKQDIDNFLDKYI